MMKKIFVLNILLLSMLIFFSSLINAQDLSGKDIVKLANDKANGSSSIGKMKMTIVRPAWSREVSMKVWSLGTEYYMIYITDPVKDKGQVFMKRDRDMWNWMPNINRMIKLPPSMMGQSWMGSDFTNDDLVKLNSIVNDYTHEILSMEEIEGLKCYKIELIPLPDAAVVWGKIILWISEEEYFQMKAEYYDEDEILVNIMTSHNIKQFNDRKLPSKMVMIPMDDEGHQTILETVESEFNTDIKESFFSQQNMKRIR